MATQPFISGKFRAFDSNGNPLSGGLLYSYAAGTSTPLSTFTDYGGLTPNANPVVLDAGGSADVWMTPGLLYKFTLKDSVGVLQWTEDNIPAPSGPAAAVSLPLIDPGGRLTLDPALSVTTTDIAFAATIYYLPHKSDQVPLYDGTTWALWSIGAGLSQAANDTTKSPAAIVNTMNYDFFIWNDGGTIRLSHGPPWTSDTARGTGVGTTELRQIDGRWANNNSITNGPGAGLGLYVGTIRSTSGAAFCDTLAVRYLWNKYNRVRRAAKVATATAQWALSSSTFRQANGSASYELALVVGLIEDVVSARVCGVAATCSTVNGQAIVAIGLDSTTAASPDCRYATTAIFDAGIHAVAADYCGYPGLGFHLLTWLERSDGGVAISIDNFTTESVAGILGEMLA